MINETYTQAGVSCDMCAKQIFNAVEVSESINLCRSCTVSYEFIYRPLYLDENDITIEKKKPFKDLEKEQNLQEMAVQVISNHLDGFRTGRFPLALVYHKWLWWSKTTGGNLLAALFEKVIDEKFNSLVHERETNRIIRNLDSKVKKHKKHLKKYQLITPEKDEQINRLLERKELSFTEDKEILKLVVMYKETQVLYRDEVQNLIKALKQLDEKLNSRI